MRSRSGQGSMILNYAILIVHTLVVMFPLVVLIMSAFKSTPDVLFRPLALPTQLRFDNFVRVWGTTDFLTYLRNSILVSTISVALILMLGIMASFALSRYSLEISGAIYSFFLIGLTLPMKLGILPLFFLIRALALMDTLAALVLIYTATGLPFAVMVITGFIKTIPAELDEAARLDGCSEMRLIWSILIPTMRPAMATVGLYSFVNAWNDFFFPLIFVRSNALKTIPLGMTVFFGEFETDWALLFTGLLMASAPSVVAYIAMSRQFISGLTSGAVKA